jgi:hypothetical protein
LWGCCVCVCGVGVGLLCGVWWCVVGCWLNEGVSGCGVCVGGCVVVFGVWWCGFGFCVFGGGRSLCVMRGVCRECGGGGTNVCVV